LIQRKVGTRRLAYPSGMLATIPIPVCPMCGALMALRYRNHGRTTDVWACPASHAHAGAACYALVPPAGAVPAYTPADDLDDVVWRSAVMTPIERELQDAEDAIEHCRRNAERHIAEAERRERIGRDASHPRQLSRTFRWLLGEHKAHRDRLLAELMLARRISP
jgi:hypothetical protein